MTVTNTRLPEKDRFQVLVDRREVRVADRVLAAEQLYEPRRESLLAFEQEIGKHHADRNQNQRADDRGEHSSAQLHHRPEDLLGVPEDLRGVLQDSPEGPLVLVRKSPEIEKRPQRPAAGPPRREWTCWKI